MIDSLPLFHRIAGHPVIVLGQGDAAEAKRRLVERAGGQVIDDIAEGIDKGARLAFVAHDNPAACEGDAIRLRCAGLLVNVVDRPELCDFTTPSLLDRSPVLVAIGTGGASAGLAKALRLRLEALVPQGLGDLARGLFAARARLRAVWPDGGDRRRALDSALSAGGPLDPLDEATAERLSGWLDHPDSASLPRQVEIRLRSADPEDLTLREARLLGSADLLAHEPGVAPAILDRARADARRLVLPSGQPAPEAPGLTVILRA
ncbi:MAG TPA: siroheme synthase [Novosphingobium sp.]|nr:siroheme synthase [Novosphingobium sp.]